MEAVMSRTQYLPAAEIEVGVEPLPEQSRNEVLAFLEERPVHTVCMIGFIRDNGLESPHNRGTFYGCRNSEGRLEGVALIGHATLIEARTARAMQEFARTAQIAAGTQLILGEQDRVEQFWNFYADEGEDMRLICHELLFELKRSPHTPECSDKLRLATLDDLSLIVPIHAQLAFAESGRNPLEQDPVGFKSRCARRIEKGRIWVAVQDGKLVFKADVQADTPDVIYLEGVYVDPMERGKGVGRRCLSEMTQRLLTRAKSICVLVNEANTRAQSFYRLCNFKLRDHYYTIFLQRQMQSPHQAHL